MSYRERQTRRRRRGYTVQQLRRIYTRDLRFCRRHGILAGLAYQWDRYPLDDYAPDA